MALMRYGENSGVGNLWDQMHRELDRLFDARLGQLADNEGTVADWIPAVDIKEEEGRFLIHVDVPGVDPENIDIQMENSTLAIRGHRALERKDERQGYSRIERVRGQFYRRFTLPETADAESISARCDKGVLEITVPKRPEVQPRKITVQS